MAKKTTGKITATEKAIKETASEIMKEAVNKAKEVKETVAEKAKETTVKTKETVSKSKETAAKKEAPAVKPAAKKAAAETCFVEFAGKQISVDEVTENAKKHWKASNNGTISDIKVYINTKESKAYYVVNNEDRGDFEL